MNFNKYQKEAKKLAIYPDKYKVIYPALGLAGETGECIEHVKKSLRDNDGVLTKERRDKITLELGDVLWYLANLASDLNMSLDDIAELNLHKLTLRKKNDTLKGDGDLR